MHIQINFLHLLKQFEFLIIYNTFEVQIPRTTAYFLQISQC